MNVTDWQDRKFASIEKEKLILCNKAQVARRCYAKWFEKQKNNMKFQYEPQQKYYDAWVAQRDKELSVTQPNTGNPYIVHVL